MTISKGFLIIILSSLTFALGGALIGYCLGMALPDYYRTVFSSGREPGFNPVAVGLGLGITQGLFCGVVVGAVVVLSVAWQNSRQRPPEIDLLDLRRTNVEDWSVGERGITSNSE